ncbi:MAG: hypothetical protein V9G19_27440 [Tetrasphaera sp.]
MSTRHFTRRAVSALAVAGFLAAPAVVGTASPAFAAGSGKIIASPCLNLRTGPSSGYGVLACIPVNTYISIDCTITGAAVSGPYGTTTLWDHTSYAGKSGYVSDAWVYTGTANPVAPTCGTSSREDRAVAWANSMVGSQSYAFLCERFAENAYGTSGRYGSAISAFYALQNAGMMHYNSTGIPKGALVFSRSSADQGYGHVEVSRGDGSFVSGGMGNPTVQVTYTPVPGRGGSFLGWSYAPSNWPGR